MKLTITHDGVVIDDGPPQVTTLPPDDTHDLAVLQALIWGIERIQECIVHIESQRKERAAAGSLAAHAIVEARRALH